VFLTNSFTLPALTITQLYKCRWQVELFFQWLKTALANQGLLRDLRERRQDQLWIAIAVYVLVAIVKTRLHLEASLYTILQILSVSLFEKIPLLQALPHPKALPSRTIPITS
jgi:IS4 transposase